MRVTRFDDPSWEVLARFHGIEWVKAFREWYLLLVRRNRHEIVEGNFVVPEQEVQRICFCGILVV